MTHSSPPRPAAGPRPAGRSPFRIRRLASLTAFACFVALCGPNGLGASPAEAATKSRKEAVPAPARKKKAPAKPAATTKSDIAEKRSDLKDIRGQIAELRKGVATTEDKRADTLAQLKSVEQEISTTQRGLFSLSDQRSKLQTTLNDLARQSHDLEGRLGQQQEQLERLAYHQYVQGSPDALHLLLNGDNPNQTARDLYYLGLIGRSRNTLLHEIEDNLQRKRSLAADTKDRAGELSEVEARQKEQHGKLLAQREQRKAVLSSLSEKLADQRREIGSLQRDERNLSQLVDQLAKELAKERAAKPPPRVVPRPEAGSKNQAKGERSQRSDRPETPTTRPAAPEVRNENTPEPVSGVGFANLRGNLRLPVRGVVSNRFGAARQEGSAWKGLFIRAGHGNEVKAVAGGRVVFADWMRGFGNLIIIDHGNSYLTIYGNNEAVLKQTGDAVRGGDVIASVGNSGGNPESGLYFELRYQGQPQDPLKWVSLK